MRVFHTGVAESLSSCSAALTLKRVMLIMMQLMAYDDNADADNAYNNMLPSVQLKRSCA